MSFKTNDCQQLSLDDSFMTAGRNSVTKSEENVPYPSAVIVPSTWVTFLVCTVGFSMVVPVMVKSSNTITCDEFSTSDEPTFGVSSHDVNIVAARAMAATRDAFCLLALSMLVCS